jgi:hypothetical protein
VGDPLISVLVGSVLADGVFDVGYGRRNHVSTARPFAQIDEAAAVAAEREVGIGGLGGLFADWTAMFQGTFAWHSWIEEVRSQIAEFKIFSAWMILPLQSDL